MELTLVISKTDVSEDRLISKNIFLHTSQFFLYNSTPAISNYWYLKVNFLGPENLL